MPFRSHVGRSLDLTNRTNLVMLGMSAGLAVVAVVLWLGGSPGSVFLAPVHGFLVWALVREIDPDHPWVALVAGAGAGAWAFRGGPMVSALAVAGVMVGARLVSGTTGRRPLPTDLAVLAVAAAAIGFTIEGWVAGFGLAVAFYLDDRMSGQSRGAQIAAAAVSAIGVTLVATLTGAFPEAIPAIDRSLVLAAGIIALTMVVREPAEPLSVVDARHGARIEGRRLHTARTLSGVLAFAITLVVGARAPGMAGVLFGLLLAIASNEWEIRRRR
jgi:hypothetical protein